jgi:hypothetical protein
MRHNSPICMRLKILNFSRVYTQDHAQTRMGHTGEERDRFGKEKEGREEMGERKWERGKEVVERERGEGDRKAKI